MQKKTGAESSKVFTTLLGYHDDLSTTILSKKLRASIERDVQCISSEVCHSLGLDVTKPAMELILDVFFHKIALYADDLERFAKHAKRSMITSDDCRLLTRRNNTLTTHITSLKIPGSTSKEAVKRRRTAIAGSSPKRARTLEKTTRTSDSTVRTSDSTVRPANSTVRISNSTGQTSDSTARTSEILVRPNEEPELDADIAIDLTFD